jgi:hypothetical protein
LVPHPSPDQAGSGWGPGVLWLVEENSQRQLAKSRSFDSRFAQDDTSWRVERKYFL